VLSSLNHTGKVGLLALLCLLIAQIDAPKASECTLPVDIAQAARFLYEVDASEALAGLELIPPSDPRYNNSFRSADFDFDNLTQAEKRLAGSVLLDGGHYLSTAGFVSQVTLMHHKHGCFPETGLELTYMFGAHHLSPEKLEAAQKLSPIEVCEMYPWAFNAGTGKVHTGLTDPNWRPLGVYIEKLQGEEGVLKVPHAEIDQETGEARPVWITNSMYRVTVFGEEPGSVILVKDSGFPVNTENP
jgi:hypothetical protein